MTGLYYVCASDAVGVFSGGASYDDEPVAGNLFLGGSFGSSSLPTQGVFAAIDVTTNTLAWSQRWSDECYSGSVTTAGGLTFVGRNDGRFTALDSSTGHRLWEFQTGAGANAPASVFEHGGDQYVVVYAAGNLFAGSTRGDRVWLFALHGELTEEDQAVEASSADAASDGDALAVAATGGDAVLGRRLYTDGCEACHGPTGTGGHSGMLLGDSLTPERIFATVTQGRNDMPSFADDLDTDEIRAVVAYVRSMIESR